VEGSDGGSLTEGTEELPIPVRFSNQARANLDLIGTTELRSMIQRGPTAFDCPPLAALARLNLTSDVATISRVDGQRMNEVKAYITAGTLPAEVISEFERRVAASDFRLPAGYSLRLRLHGDRAFTLSALDVQRRRSRREWIAVGNTQTLSTNRA
jgi:multidrug efflux pump subunit AcrB